jgi:hypothetical protein
MILIYYTINDDGKNLIEKKIKKVKANNGKE